MWSEIVLTRSLLPPCGDLGKALSYINKHFFSDANGNRGGAPNVAVVLVDGWPTDKVEEASRLARESGINIFFVTIEGPDDNEKLNVVEANFVDKVNYILQQSLPKMGNVLDPGALFSFLLFVLDHTGNEP